MYAVILDMSSSDDSLNTLLYGDPDYRPLKSDFGIYLIVKALYVLIIS